MSLLTPVCAKVILLLCLASVAHGQMDVRDEGDRLVLCNPQAAIVLDKDAGGTIVSLIEGATGRELVTADPAVPLFRVGLSLPGDTAGKLTWLTALDAKSVACSVQKSGLRPMARLNFKKLGGRQLDADCTVSIAADDQCFLWQFGLTGPEPLILERVEYPLVVLRAPARGQGVDDAFVAGDVRGGLYPRPSRWPVGKGLSTLNQPGPLAAQFGCYYDARSGFYSATQDNQGYPKRLRFRRTNSGLEFAWERYCYHDLSKHFELGYAVAQATFRSQDPHLPTDWRDAADLYKAWALRQPWCTRTLAQRDDVPGWLKEGPAMVRFRRRHTYYKPNVRLEYHHDWYSHPDQIRTWLKEYWQESFAEVPLIVAFWGWERVSSWISPHYFPPHPSEEGLRQRVQAVRDVGGHPFFWPSGYHWAETFNQRADGTFVLDDRQAFERVGTPHAVITRDGSPFGKKDFWLNGGTNRVLCRGDAWSRQWLDGIATELAKRGADLIQVDQVTYGCSSRDRGCCYSSKHGHPPGPGPWFVKSFIDQLQTMRRETRRLNPNIVLGFEGAQELYLQDIGIQDYRDFEVYWNPGGLPRVPASVFAYLYHEFVPFFQSNPEGFRGKPAGGNMLLMAYSLVQGQMPHLVPHWPLRPLPALTNGGFEECTGDLPGGWNPSKGAGSPKSAGLIRCDPETKHGGRFSLRIESPRGDQPSQIQQCIPVGEYEREVGCHGPEVGKRYRLRFWLKADALGKASKAAIRALNGENGATGSWQTPLAPCDDWQPVEVAFQIPERTVLLEVTLQLTGPCKAWVDDVALEEPTAKGAYQTVMQKPILAAEDKLARQWIKLFHGEGRPYLLLGRMLHLPALDTERADYTITQPIKARVPLHVYASDGKIVQTAPIDMSQNTDWVHKEVDLTIPDSAEHCTVHLFLQTKGRYWFDDVRLTELDSERELITNGGFEQWEDPLAAPSAWNKAKSWGGKPCKGKHARDEHEKHAGKFALRLTNAEDDVVHLSQSLRVDGKTLQKGKRYRLSLWLKVQDADQLDLQLPAILHNAYRAPDGSEAVVAVNITNKPQTGRLHWHGKVIGLTLDPWEAQLIRQ